MLGQRERRRGSPARPCAEGAARASEVEPPPGRSPPIVEQPVAASHGERERWLRARERIFIVRLPSPVLTGAGSRVCGSRTLSTLGACSPVVVRPVYDHSGSRRTAWRCAHAEPPPWAPRRATRWSRGLRCEPASSTERRGRARAHRRPARQPRPRACRPGRCRGFDRRFSVQVETLSGPERRLPGVRPHAARHRAGAHAALPARRRLRLADRRRSTCATPPGWPGAARPGRAAGLPAGARAHLARLPRARSSTTPPAGPGSPAVRAGRRLGRRRAARWPWR